MDSVFIFRSHSCGNNKESFDPGRLCDTVEKSTNSGSHNLDSGSISASLIS